MVDFRTLVAGTHVTVDGDDYRVTQILYQYKGWVYVLATSDGIKALVHTTCGCTEKQATVKVVDLVTEAEYTVCSSCRGIARV